MVQRTSTPVRRPGSARSSAPGSDLARSTSRAREQGAAEGKRVVDKAAGQTQEVVAVAQGAAQEVAATAVEEARQVGATVKDQASRVGEEAVEQGRVVLEQTRYQVEEQANLQVQRLAGTLAGLAEEAKALVQGRPHEAATLAPYVTDVSELVQDVADRFYVLGDDIQDRGLGEVLGDLQAFARRRPGTFLLTAAAAGLGLGRVARVYSDHDGGPAPSSGRARAGGRGW